MIIHPRSIARSAAVSLALFALAACGSGGGGDSSSSSAPPAPSTAARQVALTDAENTQHCQGRGGIKVLTGIDDNRDGDLDVPDEVDATEYVCNGEPGAIGPQGNPGVDGTATVIIYFELGQTFSLSEDAAAGDSAGTIGASTSNGAAVTFTEADSSSDAFDVSDAGEITLAADVSLDFETQSEYIIAVVATATDAPPAHFSVRVAITDVDETPFQNGTAEHPYLVDSLAKLQSIAIGFSNEHIATNCFGVIGCDDGKLSAAASLTMHYRQTADIDASPTASGTWLLDDKGNSDASDDEHGFQPIEGTFSGSYDGGGYLISGLFISRSGSDNVGLFGQTSGSSVLENVALVGVDVRGKNDAGALVGVAAGTVRESFASGRLQGESQIGGLIGQSTGTVEDSFAAVTTAASDLSGGLVGAVTGGPVFRSFALGLVAGGNGVGGLAGTLAGALSHSFAAGDINGNLEAGLVGIVISGSVSDSYATGTATFGLLGQGTATRSYRVSGADADTDGTKIALDGLRALACAATTDFRWDDPNDSPDGGPLDCATAGAEAFPWDFGTSADLPVINGLVGGLDAEGQRRAVEFSLVDRAAVTGAIPSGETSVDVTLTAPTVGREAGSVLSYFWVLERSTAISADGLRARDVIITAAAGTYAAHLTIIERDAEGTLLAVYADEFTLTVN